MVRNAQHDDTKDKYPNADLFHTVNIGNFIPRIEFIQKCMPIDSSEGQGPKHAPLPHGINGASGVVFGSLTSNTLFGIYFCLYLILYMCIVIYCGC